MNMNTSNYDLVEILEKRLVKLPDKIESFKAVIESQQLNLMNVKEFMSKQLEMVDDDIYKIATDSDDECYHQRSVSERIILEANRDLFTVQRCKLKAQIAKIRSVIEKYEFKLYCKELIQKDLQRQLAEVKLWMANF